MINRALPHVWVLPEDDANRQIANGFVDHPNVNLGELERMRATVRPCLFPEHSV